MYDQQPEDSYRSLIEKFEATKKELTEAEETIKRITGRDDVFTSGPAGLSKWKNQLGPGPIAGRQFPGRKRPLFPIRKSREDEVPPPPEEESGEEEETPSKRPSLLSTVVATPKDVKSRRDTIQEQNVNSNVKARNRRMFGMILGTLQKFQHEAKESKEKDKRKAEIEQKVEAAAAEERERIKKEKEELFFTRREKQMQLRCLERKIQIAETHSAWENTHKYLGNFIKTEAQPHVYFLPATHTPESEKRLQATKTEIAELIAERKAKMEKDLSEVEAWYHKENFPSDKENIGPVEEDNPPAEQQDIVEDLPEVELESSTVETEDKNGNNLEANSNNLETNGNNLEALADQEFEPIYD